MSNRLFLVPLRNDLTDVGVQVLDLTPNTSLKTVYDPPGQTHYISSCLDHFGATVVDGTTYVSGSRTTTLTGNPTVTTTTGSGNTCYATTTTTFGLAAYLVERVQRGGSGGSFVTYAEANAAAQAILDAVVSGSDLDLDAINTILVANIAASTTLTTVGSSKSFGDVEEVLRIVAGEVYAVPRYTIVTNSGGPLFLNLSERATLVSNQNSGVTGKTFVATGGFLSHGEAGFDHRPHFVLTGRAFSSIGNGNISKLTVDTTILNPLFTYGSGGTAKDIAGDPLSSSGSSPILAVYASDGTRMA